MAKVELVAVPGTDDAYEAALDKMLAYLGADMPVRHSCRPITLREFDRGWPLVDPMIEGWTRYSSHTLDEECIPAWGNPDDLAGPLDVTIVGALLDDADRPSGKRGDLIPLHQLDKTIGFAVNRVRRRFPAELRGQLRIAVPHVIQFDVLMLPDNGEPETFRFLWGEVGHDKWVGVDLPYFRHKGNRIIWTQTSTNTGEIAEDKWGRRIAQSYGIAMFLDRQWSVSFKFEGNYLGLTFPTAPEHAQDVFRLRDVPPGMKRREALKHWVREHYRRRDRDDAVATIPVMRHLRGAETFHWNGLECRIAPSPADLRDLAQRRAARRRDRSGPSHPRLTAMQIEAAVAAEERKQQREAARAAAERAREGRERWATFWEHAAFHPPWWLRMQRRLRQLAGRHRIADTIGETTRTLP